MTIRLDEKDHIACFWLATDVDDNEFMMILYKRSDRWMLDYRFRYKKDDRVWGSDDTKSFYHAEIPTKTEDEILRVCRETFDVIGVRYCMNRICQRIDGDLNKFIETMKKYDSFHVRKEPT